MDRMLEYIESFLKRQISRAHFLKVALSSIILFLRNNFFLGHALAKGASAHPRTRKNLRGLHDIVVTEGSDPYQNTIKAIEAMGGMGKFVAKNSVVVVKPNMAWDRSPQQAANTDPSVVAALVDLCYKAGAKRVNVFDIPCNDERRVYEHSGIRDAAKAKGAHVYFADHWNVVKAHFPYESPMEGWPILRDAVVCDTFINVPVLKHHGLTGLTLSMKNLMGVCSGTRGLMHVDIGRKLVDVTDFIFPELTVIDATRFLSRNGPSGGNVDDVRTLNKIIVATDPTLADCYATQTVQKDPMEVPYLKVAIQRGFGISDVSKADIHYIKI